MDNPQVCVECIACGKRIPVFDPRTDTSIKLCDDCKKAIQYAKEMVQIKSLVTMTKAVTVSMELTTHQAELLIGMLEDQINDEDFQYAYNETDRNALKKVYEKYKQLVYQRHV